MDNKKYYTSSKNFNQEVQEPVALYMTVSSIQNTVLENISKNSKDLFKSVVSQTGLTIQFLADKVFEITPKTFIKYKNNNVKIPSRISEMAIEITHLYQLGNEVFGSNESFNTWMDTQNPFFQNQKPNDFINTSAGIHWVYEEIKRIEFGATA